MGARPGLEIVNPMSVKLVILDLLILTYSSDVRPK